MNDLRLYVWSNVLTDYTQGIMFALATSVEHARKLISEDMGYSDDELGDKPEVYDSPVGFHVYGGG